ncbi:MAG TPA: DUF4349 domain-containing protein [Actinomycetota bacterium]|nr:DUF4349 domain-containing protein [Actinomycetota bacterium]
MTHEDIEAQIRHELNDRAENVRVPDGLGARTMEAARTAEPPALTDRVRAWRDARSIGGRHGGFPKLAYASAAAVTVLVLFVIGTGLTTGPARYGSDSRPALVPGSSAGTEDLRRGAPAAGAGRDEKGAPVQSQPEPAIEPDAARSSSQSGGAMGAPAPDTSGQTDDTASRIMPPIGPGQPGTFPPKVIRNAELEVRVRKGRFTSAWSKANGIASKHGGFVTNSSTESLRNRLARGTLTARVPADKLDAAVTDFRALGTMLRHTSSGNDVSGGLVDLDARIRAAQAQEAQLLELLKQARSVSDTIQVRSRLDSVRQEIESLQAQKQHLQGQVDMATIQASIYEPDAAPDRPDDEDGLGDAFDVARRIAMTIFQGLIVSLGLLIPLGLIGLAVWGMFGLIRRRR